MTTYAVLCKDGRPHIVPGRLQNGWPGPYQPFKYRSSAALAAFQAALRDPSCGPHRIDAQPDEVS